MAIRLRKATSSQRRRRPHVHACEFRWNGTSARTAAAHGAVVGYRTRDVDGRDALLRQLDAHPDLLDGFERVLEAAGVAPYRRITNEADDR